MRRDTGIIIIVTIIVIISQMRKAKLEFCPSQSDSLTVTNSSLIHSTHQLYTGQRSPERQDAAKAPLCHASSPTAAQRRITAQCAQRFSSMSSFKLCESRRQLVIMPLATVAMCGCHAHHHVAKVKSSVQQTHHEELCRHENKRGFP